MRPALTIVLLAAALAATSHAAEPAVSPEVARRDLRLPRLPNTDFVVGLYSGTYATQNFGAAPVLGMRLGYHLNEDWFVEATLARTRVEDDAFRQVLPGGVFPNRRETLSYAALSAGWNLLPGEVFVGRGIAKASSMYLVAGLGSTQFFEQRRQSLNFGAGLRVLLRDDIVVQVDLRDHLFSLDLLGRRQSTHNLEATLGVGLRF